TVGEDNSHHVLGPVDQPRPVRKHQADAQHLPLGEHPPAVEEHDLPVDRDGGAVPADLAEPAEDCDRDAHRPPTAASAFSMAATVSAEAFTSGRRTSPTVPQKVLTAALTGAGLVSRKHASNTG